MAINNKKKTQIPLSLQPRKKIKKTIPNALNITKNTTTINQKNIIQEKTKERFTLWLSQKTHKAFKLHTATQKQSASEYIENLIKKDLNID